MNCVYHGSKISGLKIINPNKSTHQKELVYATLSPCIATIFLSNGGSDLVYVLGGRGTKEKPAYLIERLPGVFDKIFNGSGSIYTLNGDSFEHREGFWNAEVVSDKTQFVIKEEKIENIKEKLKEYEENGLLNIYRYPNRIGSIPLDNSDLIDKYINFYNMGHTKSIEQLLSLYPEFTDEVNNRVAACMHTENIL